MWCYLIQAFLCLVFDWMTCLWARIGYWSDPLVVCLLCTWVPFCMGHKYLQFKFGGFYLWCKSLLISSSFIWYKNNYRKQWCRPLFPALGRQRQVDFWVQGQPGLYRETLSWKTKQNNNNKKNRELTRNESIYLFIYLFVCLFIYLFF